MNENEVIVDFKLKDFKKNTYWTICKFMNDDYTIESASSKRSLIGDFIDRWTNKAPEALIFNELLKEYNCQVVNDTFIYSSSKAKNAPDILGVINEDGKIFPFSKFNNECWESYDNNPIIEIKTFRKSQKLVTIPESQFDDESYFVIVESDFPKDYILSLFDKDFFNEDNIVYMDYYEEFIISDENNVLSTPSKLISQFENADDDNVVGKYTLIGIFKGKDLNDYGKIVKKGENPFYFSGIGKAATRKNKKLDINPPKPLTSGKFYYRDDENNLPCFIKIHNGSNVFVTREIDSAVDIKVDGSVEIDNQELYSGKYRLLFNKFPKGGDHEEFITTKSCLRLNKKELSSLDELLSKIEDIII